MYIGIFKKFNKMAKISLSFIYFYVFILYNISERCYKGRLSYGKLP